MDLVKLQEEKARLIAEARGLVNRADSEKRGLSADEVEQKDRIFKRVNEIHDLIATEERVAAEERALNSVSEKRAELQTANGDVKSQSEEVRKKAFNKLLRYGKNELSSEEVRALSVGTDAAGGYTVAPTDFQARVIEAAQNSTFMLGLIDVITMGAAKKVQMPKLTADPDDADWVGEITAVTEDTGLAFGNFELDPNPASKLVKISETLLRDSAIDIEGLIARKLGYRFGVTLEKGFLTGDGSGKPDGVFTTAGISTARDLQLPTGNATDILSSVAGTVDTFVKAKFRIKEGYHAGLVWLMNRLIFEKVALFKDSDNNYILTPAIIAGENDRIRGVAVKLSEYAPSTVSANSYVALLGNFKNYMATVVQPFRIQRLNELYAATNQVGFIGRMEADGACANEEAFIRIKASAA